MNTDDRKKHYYSIGNRPPQNEAEAPQATEADGDGNWSIPACRRNIEPWLSAIFQSEHLSLLVGNGLTTAVAHKASVSPANMDMTNFGGSHSGHINEYAKKIAGKARGEPNIEDQIRAALRIADGLDGLSQDVDAIDCRDEIDKVMTTWIEDLLKAERALHQEIVAEPTPGGMEANQLLCGFLLSFASRATTRDRLHVFTTNYDRLIEFGCDWIGLRIIDRFVGRLSPIFRASRLGIDIHYNPPGIRGEPRYLEGVMRLTKLHGSIDWRYEKDTEVAVR